MTFRELEDWRTKHKVADTWWVSMDGVVQNTTFGLAEALQIKSRHPDHTVSILNSIYANQPNPTWVALTLSTVNVIVPGEVIADSQPAARAQPVAQTAAAAAPEKAAPVVAALPDDFLEKFSALRADFERLRAEVAALRKIADTYKDSFAEAKAILDERESFLEASETQLFEKAQRQEVRSVELDQLADNLAKREAAIKASGG